MLAKGCRWSTPTPNFQNLLTTAPLLISGPSHHTWVYAEDRWWFRIFVGNPTKPTVWLEGRGLMLSGISWTSRMGVALKLNSVTWPMPRIYSCVMPVFVYEHALGGQRPTWVSFPRCLSCFYLIVASWLDQQVNCRDLSVSISLAQGLRSHVVCCRRFKVGGLIQILKLLRQTFYQLSYLPSLCSMARPSLPQLKQNKSHGLWGTELKSMF